MKRPMLTAVIVDDEQAARHGLVSYVNRTPSLSCVGEFRDVSSLEAYLRRNPAPDIIFMDIRMPEVSGLDFMASTSVDSAVVFVTAYEQYALRGFELDVCDYLLKPVSYARFLQAVEKASNYACYRKGLMDDDILFLREDRMMRRVRISDVEYVESMENYVKVVVGPENVVTRSTLKEFLEPLSGKGIIQVHKSYAVNVGRIRSVAGDRIMTEGGYRIPLSRKFRKGLLSLISGYKE